MTRRILAFLLFLVPIVGALLLPSGLAAVPTGEASGPSPLALTASWTLTAVADARVSEGSPTQNYGSGSLAVGYHTASGLDLSLILFDVSSLPPGITITSAALRVLATDLSGTVSPVSVSVRRSTGSWAEGSVTWNSKPASADALASASTSGQQWVTWDITGQVIEWYNGQTNSGLELGGPATDGYSLYFRSRESSDPPELVVNYETEQTVTPSVTPSPSPTPTPTPTPTKTPSVIITPVSSKTPTPTTQIAPYEPNDLVATDIEVSQGIQNLDNDMPLVEDRRTIVRVYVRNDAGRAVNGVRARLHGTRGGLPISGSPQEANNNPIRVEADGGDRRNLDDSFWFYLDSDWRQGTVTFRAEVNYDDGVLELDKSDNEIIVTRSFHEAETFNVVLVPLHLHRYGDSDNATLTYWGTEESRWDIYNSMYRLHPISDRDAWHFSDALYPDWHGAGNEWDLRSSSDRSGMLSKIAWKNFWTSNWADELHYMGGVHPQIPVDGVVGLARLYSLNSWVKMESGNCGQQQWCLEGGVTMAHELAHNERREHASCTGDEETVDNNYPWPHPDCRLAEVDEDGYYGLDVYYGKFGLDEPAVIDNDDDAYPLMGYRSPHWIDPYTYCALLDRYGVNCNLSFGAAPAAPSAPSVPSAALETSLPEADPSQLHALRTASFLLAVDGVLDLQQGAGHIDHVALQSANQVFGDNLAQAERQLQLLAAGNGGAFSLEVQNALGDSISSRLIVPDEACGGDLFASFLELLAWPPDAVTVTLKCDGTVVDAATGSAHPPVVTLLYPNGGETLTRNPLIRWEAVDADGEDLYFNVLYSLDGGTNWRAIALDVAGREYQPPPMSPLPGTDQGLIRIVASDGFYTVSDDSNGTFTVPGSPPRVSIHYPVEGSRHHVSRPLVMDGSADDLEDGELAGPALVWRSNKDGLLGIGEELHLQRGDLSFGRHLIVLTATDSDGMTAEATVGIIYEPFGGFLPMLFR